MKSLLPWRALAGEGQDEGETVADTFIFTLASVLSRRGMGGYEASKKPSTPTVAHRYVGTCAEWMATVPNASLRTSTLTRPAFSIRAVSSSTVRNPCTDSGR